MVRKSKDMEIEKRENMRGGKGTIKIIHFFKKEEFKTKVRLCAKLIIPPGCSIGLHQHLEEEEVFLVVKGKGILSDGRENSIIEEGDAILTKNGESHSVENTEKENLEIIAFITQY